MLEKAIAKKYGICSKEVQVNRNTPSSVCNVGKYQTWGQKFLQHLATVIWKKIDHVAAEF
jgi:hypothetical protein